MTEAPATCVQKVTELYTQIYKIGGVCVCGACLQFQHVGGKSSFNFIAGLRQPDLYKILPRIFVKGRLGASLNDRALA